MPDKYVLAGELCSRKYFEERLPEVMEISLYRIIQEWVNNLIKYAQASQIEIQLKRYDDAINVIIEDNGPGVNKQTLIQSEGNGWKNIQSRISILNRTIDIESTAGRSGTSFICKVAVAISKHTEKITL
ncbi:Histidine kinase-, DNA gyrase B-, and HSP90-like ATPase [Marivirga sericea]|uniref:histidine kinase n=1 Tax=Marivirga sericea TaxID=1028 RepID=A0A1X7LG80_9BACT|nr:ATP-binding protein [Marivirga sericea]SMG52527.1 Histidine kinase-, DNA gyrase B-, and HSP90-like ATPase [Marivirga sericea]